MIKYQFREPLTLVNASKADPQVVGEALAKLKADNGGVLKVGDIWKKVQKLPRHPLHKHYEWDVRKAAEAHWNDTDRRIIRSIEIVREDEEPVPAFHSIGSKAGTSYHHHSDVMSSAELQLAVLKSAERDLEAFERRYRTLSDLCEEIRGVRERVAERRANMESRAST